MTDGERLVWATTYSIALDRSGGDSVAAVRAAAQAVTQLRAEAVRKLPARELGAEAIDERDFLDEIVSVP